MRYFLLPMMSAVYTAFVVSMSLEFTQHPSDREAILNQDVMFQCQYVYSINGTSDVGVTVTWYLDNVSQSLANNHPCEPMASSPNITCMSVNQSNLKIVTSTLKMTATSACNATEVYCLVVLYTLSAMGIPEVQTQAQSNSAQLYVENIQVIENAMLQVHANGNINVTWNPITFSQRLQNTIGNATVKYQISITNDKSGETMSECIERSVISTNKIHHEFQHSGDGNQSQCETFTFRITPIINGDVDSAGRTTVVSQDLDPIDFVTSGNVTFIGGDYLEFTFFLPIPMPFCNISIDATDHVSGIRYALIRKARMESGATNRISFRVENAELPFDGHYTAMLNLSNQHRVQTVKKPIQLSTYSIQNVSRESSKILLSFVRNTTAMGAFVVCSNSSKDDGFNYILAERVRGADTLELRIVPEGDTVRNCNMLVFDVKNDGQLQDTTVIRPAFRTQGEPCIIGCPSESDNVTTNNNNYLVSATAGDGYIIFECNISSSLDSESDILGCIAIVHNSDSSLIVNKIHKDNLTMNVSVEPGRTYPYSVFLWKMSGLLVNDPTEVIKGSVPINIPDQTASDSELETLKTTEVNINISEELPSTAITVSAVISVTVILTLVVTIAVIIIVCKNMRSFKTRKLEIQKHTPTLDEANNHAG